MSEIKPFKTLPRGLAPLGYREFLLYWLGLIAKDTGRWIEMPGILWLVYTMTDSPIMVGLAGAARALPNLLASPLAGVVADRLNPRRVLVWAQGLSCACSLVTGALVLTGRIELWHLYLQVAFQAAVLTFDSAAQQALYVSLVPPHLLNRAVALRVSATRVAKFVGPALGGFLIAGAGPGSVFVASAILCLGMALAALMMRIDTFPTDKAAASLMDDFMAGVRHISSSPVLRGLLKLEIIFGIFEMNPTMIAIIGRELLNVGPIGLGFLLSAPALGSFLAILWLLVGSRAFQSGRFSIICALIYSTVLLGVALSTAYAATFAALAVVGILEVLMVVNRQTIMQAASPSHKRGRVMSNMGLITRGVGPLADTQSGFFASLLGPMWANVGAAAVIAGSVIILARRNGALWDFKLAAQVQTPGVQSPSNPSSPANIKTLKAD